MRQLLAEGWMHNRVRMIVASFLVKDLHIEWMHGARHFDAAPRRRGPGQQPARLAVDRGHRHGRGPVLPDDEHGTQVRLVPPRWLEYHPPLGRRAGRADRRAEIHEPWRRKGGLPDGYPERIVDHATERAASLANYQALRARS